MHLICSPRLCITFVFHFSLVLQPSQEKLKTMLMQNFGGQIRCIMGNVQVIDWVVGRASLVVGRGSWVVGRGSCVVGRASWVVRRASCVVRRASCVLTVIAYASSNRLLLVDFKGPVFLYTTLRIHEKVSPIKFSKANMSSPVLSHFPACSLRTLRS